MKKIKEENAALKEENKEKDKTVKDFAAIIDTTPTTLFTYSNFKNY